MEAAIRRAETFIVLSIDVVIYSRCDNVNYEHCNGLVLLLTHSFVGLPNEAAMLSQRRWEKNLFGLQLLQ